MSQQEIFRLFGSINRPAGDTNVRHRAILRKALELFTPQQLGELFQPGEKLKVAMGSACNFSELGKIKTNYVRTLSNPSSHPHHKLTQCQMRNERLVTRESPALSPEARNRLRAYISGYDTYFMKQGNIYRVHNEHAKSVLQAAEQTWHDWAVLYLAAQGRSRPDWALEPLPGLQRVRITPTPVPRTVSAPASRTVAARTPTTPHAQRRNARVMLPTPPPSSPASVPGSSHLRPIHVDQDEVRGRPMKRKFLGVVDVSDDEDEQTLPAPKKIRFFGFVDLTE